MEASAAVFVERARALLEGVVRGEGTIGQFERAYLELYSDAPASLPAAEAQALEEVFWAVEHHVEDAEIREPGELDDGQLLETVADCLAALGQAT